jgi:hypothetical protein
VVARSKDEDALIVRSGAVELCEHLVDDSSHGGAAMAQLRALLAERVDLVKEE